MRRMNQAWQLHLIDYFSHSKLNITGYFRCNYLKISPPIPAPPPPPKKKKLNDRLLLIIEQKGTQNTGIYNITQATSNASL